MAGVYTFISLRLLLKMGGCDFEQDGCLGFKTIPYIDTTDGNDLLGRRTLRLPAKRARNIAQCTLEIVVKGYKLGVALTSVPVGFRGPRRN
jgi:hypothetical protein